MLMEGVKPAPFASLLHSLILRDHGGDAIQIVESSQERAVLSCKRRDGSVRTTITYTIEEAQQDRLKDGIWSKYTADMLFAPAIHGDGRQLFRDSTMGLSVPEELGSQAIEVSGEIIDAAEAPRKRSHTGKSNRLGK